MHWTPNYLHQFPSSIHVHVKLCNILQWNTSTLFQRKIGFDLKVWQYIYCFTCKILVNSYEALDLIYEFENISLTIDFNVSYIIRNRNHAINVYILSGRWQYKYYKHVRVYVFFGLYWSQADQFKHVLHVYLLYNFTRIIGYHCT